MASSPKTAEVTADTEPSISLTDNRNPGAKPDGVTVKRRADIAAIILFGFVVPLFLVFQSYLALHNVNALFVQGLDAQKPAEQLHNAKQDLDSPNDYILFSALSIERDSETVAIHKEAMKTVIMHLGFAVISLGLMLLFLGIKDGGVDGSFSGGAFKLDLKTGSTGIVIFIAGAGMATAGGVLHNEYQTISVPQYVASTSPQDESPRTSKIDEDTLKAVAANIVKNCQASAPPADYGPCFVDTLHHFLETGQ